MMSLAVALAALRKGETQDHRRRQFDAVIALAVRIERELVEATRALAALHEEHSEEAEMAEREAAARRAEREALAATIALARANGKLIRLPERRVRQDMEETNTELGAA
jgi:hypothetical protein